jgi:hypothetical protein
MGNTELWFGTYRGTSKRGRHHHADHLEASYSMNRAVVRYFPRYECELTKESTKSNIDIQSKNLIIQTIRHHQASQPSKDNGRT